MENKGYQSEDEHELKEQKREEILEFGQIETGNKKKGRIHVFTIIGEIEGHDCLSGNAKTTKYEHILPQLAQIEASDDIDGILILLHTMGGDVEAGLAIAEMIASIHKPKVSLVLGGSHSIGVPIAVSADYSFIVPTATMVIHPVRMTGMVIGVQQTFDYFMQIQNRILNFITKHCNASKERMEHLMTETGKLSKDIGTVLVGKEAVKEKLIDEVGGIHEAYEKLYHLIKENK